jgi:hypothetical protein
MAIHVKEIGKDDLSIISETDAYLYRGMFKEP